MTTDKISEKQLVQMHETGNVIFYKPTSWDKLQDIDKCLISAWKSFLESKEKLNEQIELLKDRTK